MNRSNKVTLRIYGNLSYVYNIVRPEHLNDHIKYNLTFRPGCVFYVDGARLNRGCMYEQYLAPFDEIATKFFEESNIRKLSWDATIPYR